MNKIINNTVKRVSMSYQPVLDFWFNTENQPYWFAKSDDFDLKIEQNFKELHSQAAAGELYTWRDNINGRLAEIIVLDQFSRNLFRNDPSAFALDPLALGLAQEAIRLGLDKELPLIQRSFLYLPFMHSESKLIHEIAVKLFEDLGSAPHLKFEHMHKDIIDRFGRYPHRNAILDRTSTPEELEFLTQPNSSF